MPRCRGNAHSTDDPIPPHQLFAPMAKNNNASDNGLPRTQLIGGDSKKSTSTSLIGSLPAFESVGTAASMSGIGAGVPTASDCDDDDDGDYDDDDDDDDDDDLNGITDVSGKTLGYLEFFQKLADKGSALSDLTERVAERFSKYQPHSGTKDFPRKS